ncbi:MAG: hypothetical protein IPJ98_12925 [Bryobacterales bacterium]|nr:hypothetical protein [Bryobacterales bacterium]
MSTIPSTPKPASCRTPSRSATTSTPARPDFQPRRRHLHPHREEDRASSNAAPQGGGNYGSLLRAKLAAQGKRLAILGNDDRTADREYIRHFMLDDEREAAHPYGMQYAERYYYIDQRTPELSKVDDYVNRHAIPL